MSQRTSFKEITAEQAKLTASWKAEGRTSEAWVVADPEILEIFNAGIAFGMKVANRSGRNPRYSPDEWRKALRKAVERAAELESDLKRAKEAMPQK